MDKPLILKYLMDYIDNLVPPRHREHLCVDPIAHPQSRLGGLAGTCTGWCHLRLKKNPDQAQLNCLLI